MQFSVIYSADTPEDVDVLSFAPPQVEELWDETEDDGQYEYGYLEGRWEGGSHRKWCSVLGSSAQANGLRCHEPVRLKRCECQLEQREASYEGASSREQEREGFSLDIQEDALRLYAERNDGEIIRLFRIAETASKKDERKIFKELLAFAKVNAHRLEGLLFYKVDRAARNLFDYVELERLESELGLRFISVSQPTENTPAGRMQRRMLASMASFYTEQQSLDVMEGISRRVQHGLFCSRPPYGYRNFRRDGRGLVEVHPENAAKVKLIFELYAYHHHTVDSIYEKLTADGVSYLSSVPRFTRSKLFGILNSRAYLGEVKHKG